MFTSEDFVSYFSELEMIERNMHDAYSEVIEQINDPEIHAAFELLEQAEATHQKLMAELRRMAMHNSMK